jgi:arylsulfatase A-like enzyme
MARKATERWDRGLAGGLTIGVVLGALLWAIEVLWMHRRALPYLGTPLVSVLLVYTLTGAVVGLMAAVAAVFISRRSGLETHAVTLALTGFALTSLLVARAIARDALFSPPAGVLLGVGIALVVWAAFAGVIGRRRGRARASRGAGVWIGAVGAVVALLVFWAWNPLFYYRLPSRTAPPDAPNVVLIVVDALRADHLGAYGYGRDTSPNLDDLAARSTVFERAYSHGNRTIFAMPALFTSMYPSINGAVGYQTSMVPLADNRTTIAEMLDQRGYVSAGMMSNVYLKSAFNLTQGFDRLEQFNSNRFRFSVYRLLSLLGLIQKPSYASSGSPRAWQVTDGALRWLERFPQDSPFFLFVHYMDVHHPYKPPKRFEAMFESSPEAAAIDAKHLFERTRDMIAEAPPLDFGGVELERLIDLYDACIRSTDEQIGRLIDAVEAQSQVDGRETLIIFTSDHGDEFMEHGTLYHVNLTHQELLHVPLIVKAPVGEPGQRVQAMARHIDVLPTIAELTGSVVPDSAMGESLVGVMAGREQEAARVSFAEGDFCTAMIYDDWKIMYVDTADAFLLYDLAADPAGLVDVSDQHPDVVAKLGAVVNDYMATAAARRQSQRREAASETVRQLRALGYVN